MHTAIRKILASLLVLLLAIPLLYSVIIVAQQQVLKFNARGKFSTEIIQTISLSKHQIKWVKKGKEILISGKYFDVKSYQTMGDQVLITGYYDHKEEKLVNRLKQFFKPKTGSESQADLTAVKYLFFPSYGPQPGITINVNWKITSTGFHTYQDQLSDCSSPVFTPPPQL